MPLTSEDLFLHERRKTAPIRGPNRNGNSIAALNFYSAHLQNVSSCAILMSEKNHQNKNRDEIIGKCNGRCAVAHVS